MSIPVPAHLSRTAVLHRAKDLLASPDAWTKGASARTAAGTRCDPRSPAATSFCIGGAIDRAAEGDRDVANAVGDLVLHAVRHSGRDVEEIAPFNDDPNTTHDEVIQILEVARHALRR